MDILDKYYFLRDYSGSSNDEYAQFIITLFSHLGENLIPLIKKAEFENKNITLKKDFQNNNFIDEYTLDMLILV